MRSRSSLLSHILGSLPTVAGYYETGTGYSRVRGLLKLKCRLSASGDLSPDALYSFDKVLHNHTPISDAVLNHPGVHLLFMIRRPEQAVASVLRMGVLDPEVGWYQDPEKVTNYYHRRLDQIRRYAQAVQHPRVGFIQSDRLVDDTPTVLKNLGQWLGLNIPLTGEYTVRSKSGKKGFGDPSQRIRSGVIQGRADAGGSRLEIPDRLRDKARNAFTACRGCLRDHFPEF